MAGPVDPQIAGVHSTWTPEGYVLSDQRAGQMVPVPFRSGFFEVVAGSSTWYPAGWRDNQDGSGTKLNLNIAGGLTQVGCELHFFVYGSVIQLRWLSASTTPPFSVMVDGVVTYTFDPTVDPRVSQGYTFTDGYCEQIVARDLDDTKVHVVFVVVVQAAAARSLDLFGYGAEERMGYQKPQPKTMNGGTGLVTSVAGNYFPNTPTVNNATAIRKIVVRNLLAVAVVVYYRYSGSDVDQVSLAANARGEFDFEEPGMCVDASHQMYTDFASQTASSVTSVGTTATVTTAGAHNLLSGVQVTMAGANQAPYNGAYTITVTGATTFTYTFAGSGTSPATGTITFITGAVRFWLIDKVLP